MFTDDIQKVTKTNERNIRQAIADYFEYVGCSPVNAADFSDAFIKNLARDAAVAKTDLRELFRKSPTWDEELQSLVINGNRTHDPDRGVISALAKKILFLAKNSDNLEYILHSISFFTGNDEADGIAAIKQLAPNAYAQGKKKSRVFMALCKALKIDTNTSDFQRQYAQLADEINAKQIDFKLYVSINPAHFLTMSNPHDDSRGPTLLSCHSLTSECDGWWRNGSSGYARDNVTIIAFTADPSKPSTLNSRKTTRQLFMYKVGNGLLLQCREYGVTGGSYNGMGEMSRSYRDLVQRELSALENAANLWKTTKYKDSNITIPIERGFGGYPDWLNGFEAKVSIRKDRDNNFKTFKVGNPGLCICCGKEHSHGLFCYDCEGERCDDCGECVDADDLYDVGDRRVYSNCLDENYGYCDECHQYILSHRRHFPYWRFLLLR